ncbi:MAG TPA: SPOR domain-containing protein, partial [Chromatiales bacterium]|nr:SPOR domain-containing protein [Chromatiales bacterium]
MRGGRPVCARAIVALLALAAALPVAPRQAHAAAAGGDAQAAGGQVLGEYRTRAEARAAAAEARRRGLRVAVREVARARTLYRVRLGPFPSRREALAVAGRLREAGVPHVVRRVPGARGHEISLGAYASERRARAVGERVARRLRLRGLRVVPVRVEERRYAVVRLPPPRRAGRPGPARAERAPKAPPAPAAPPTARRGAPAGAAAV